MIVVDTANCWSAHYHHMTEDTFAYKNAMALIKDNQWSKAHDLIEVMDTQIANHIHAYLHRIEGDQWNADYWYRRAGTTSPDCSLMDEWSQIYSIIELRSLSSKDR